MALPRVTIYTDGGASPNPGPGGWGAVLLFEKDGKEHKRELSGGTPDTTNNRMELTAALEALRTLKQPCHIEFYTDSQYLKKGINEWLPTWKKNNFKGGKIQNADLWTTLDAEVSRHEISWHWVKGHAGDYYNERVDQLATTGRPTSAHPDPALTASIYWRQSRRSKLCRPAKRSRCLRRIVTCATGLPNGSTAGRKAVG